MIRPSPFIASTLPDKVFDPLHHVAFDDVFLEHNMSAPEVEIEAITRGAGLPDQGDQGWIALVGKDVLQVAGNWLRVTHANLSPGRGLWGCGLQKFQMSRWTSTQEPDGFGSGLPELL